VIPVGLSALTLHPDIAQAKRLMRGILKTNTVNIRVCKKNHVQITDIRVSPTSASINPWATQETKNVLKTT